MGRIQWGKATVGVLLSVVATVTLSGCGGGGAEAAPKPSASPAGPDLGEAITVFQDAVTTFDLTNGCTSQVPGTCWDKMTAVMEPARELRKAMNAHQGTGPAFWSEAYVLLDTMEEGMAVGEDRFVNRPKVLGSAHDLSRWLDAHPVQ
jgi:hypothetical protein